MNRTARLTWTLLALPALALLTGCHPAAAETPMPGHELYGSCKSCHGNDGEGNASIQAPTIAGLPKWYVANTLRKFRTGVRGAHPDDYEGLRMRPMSRQMANDVELDTISTYVSQMPPKHATPSFLDGDAEAGKAQYAVCMACHGPAGMGNEQLKAPPLAGQFDWYLMASIKKFKAGIRGTAATGDTTGALMAPMAATLPNEQAIKNVLAYVATFPR